MTHQSNPEIRSLEECIEHAKSVTNMDLLNSFTSGFGPEQFSPHELEAISKAIPLADENTKNLARFLMAVATVTYRFKFVLEADAFWDIRTQSLRKKTAVFDSVRHYFSPFDGAATKAKSALLDNDYNKYDRLVFEPGKEPELEIDGVRCINTWIATDLVPVDGDPKPMEDHIEWLLEGKENASVLLDYLAFVVQNPGQKVKWAPLIITQHGVGKNTIAHIMKQIVGVRNYVEPTNDELINGRNTSLVNAVLAVISETMVGDRREVGNRMKSLITEPTLRVDEKFIAVFTMENKTNFIFFSNHDDPMHLEDGDRRYWVVHSDVEKKEPKYYDQLYRWIDEENGAAIFMQSLMDHDLSRFNPHSEPPMTEAKRELIDSCKTTAGNTLRELFEEREPPFHGDLINMTSALQTLAEMKGVGKFSQQALKRFFPRGSRHESRSCARSRRCRQ